MGTDLIPATALAGGMVVAAIMLGVYSWKLGVLLARDGKLIAATILLLASTICFLVTAMTIGILITHFS